MARPFVDAHDGLAARAGREAEALAGHRVEPCPLEMDAVLGLDRGVALVGLPELLGRHTDETVVDIHELRHVSLLSNCDRSIAWRHGRRRITICHRSNDR